MEPGSFVDVLFQGEWVEGYLLSFDLGVLKVQMDYSLAPSPVNMRLCHVAEFRSKTIRNSGVSDLFKAVYNDSGRVFFLRGEVEKQVLTKEYRKNDHLFLQFFAGLLPVFTKMTDVVSGIEDWVSTLEEAISDFFAGESILFEDSPVCKAWNSVCPVLKRLLDALPTGERSAKLMRGYIQVLYRALYPDSLLQSFSTFRIHINCSDFAGNPVLRDMLYDAFFGYMSFCAKMLLYKEAIGSLLSLAELQNTFLETNQKRAEINKTVQLKMQEIARFSMDYSSFSGEVAQVIFQYNILFSPSESSFLLLISCLDEFSIQQLLLTPMSQTEAIRFAEMGFQLSFLNANFQDTLWKTMMLEAVKNNGNVAYLSDVDLCDSHEELIDLLPNLDRKQMYHLWEVAKGRTSELFRDCQDFGFFDFQSFQEQRRKGISWVVSKVEKFGKIPKGLWGEIIEFAL